MHINIYKPIHSGFICMVSLFGTKDMNNLIILPILIPLFTALLLMFQLKPSMKRRYISLVCCTFEVISSIYLISLLLKFNQITLQAGGFKAPLGVSLTADLMSALFMLILSTLLLLFTGYHIISQPIKDEHPYLLPLTQFLLFGFSLICLSGDLILLFIAYECITLSASIAIASDSPSKTSLIPHILIHAICSFLFILTLGLSYLLFGTFNLADISQTAYRMINDPRLVIFGSLLMVILAIKSGLFPFYHWLINIPKSKTTLLNNLLTLLFPIIGLYTMYRFCFTIFPHQLSFPRTLLIVLACPTMLVGIISAIANKDSQTTIRFNIIAHTGIGLIGINLLTVSSLAASIFFICQFSLIMFSLLVIESIYDFKKGWKAAKILTFLFFIQVLSLSGLPLSSGFIAKVWILLLTLKHHSFILAISLILVGLLSLYSLLKLLFSDKPSSSSPLSNLPPNPYQTGLLIVMVTLPFLLTLSFPWISPFFEKTAKSAMNQKFYSHSIFSAKTTKPIGDISL